MKLSLESSFRLDAEYYQPEYLVLMENLQKTKSITTWGEIEGKFITGPFGSEFNTENYVQDGEYRYVRGKDIKDFFPTNEDNVYIPKEDYDRLKKYSLFEGDILVSVVGTPGIGAIVDSTLPPAIFSCKSTVYRTKSINSFYFIAYLNSSYGRKLLERSVRGAVQTGLNIGDLRDLPVFLPSLNVQEDIADVIKNAKKMLDESKSLYSQAEKFLLEELGLKDFKSKDLYSVVSFSDISAVNRMDAEYFQPKFAKVVESIKKHNARKIGDLAELVGHATQSPYDDSGDIAVLAQTHMKRNLEIDASAFNNFTKEDLIKANDKKFILRKGDVLISSAGEPGLTSVWTGDYDGKVIPGSFVTIARLGKEVEPLYAGVFLNTPAGKMQFERDYTGSVQQYVYPSKIKEILMPILSEDTQQKIAELVRESHAARKKAKDLLEEAKRKVEELIESNAK